jgi:hypothetical protein
MVKLYKHQNPLRRMLEYAQGRKQIIDNEFFKLGDEI